jgi:GNAT superfamily N-acetyltransferase
MIRLLEAQDVDGFEACCQQSRAENGTQGDGYHAPFAVGSDYDADSRRDVTLTRWATPVGEPGFRRAWGVFDGPAIVGTLDVVGGELASLSHRVNMGMGILRPYRRKGYGTQLIVSAIDWCRAQPGIAWLDLGVFHTNVGAQHLYRSLGFQVIGTMVDRFRMDDHRITDISMTLNVE